MLDRPVVVVAVVGCLFAIVQWWWISNARFFGALDTDEGGAIATSLGFHRALARGPMDLVAAVFGTASGPLVPLMSIPFVTVAGRSAISPIFVQPVLVVASAIGVAGTVSHLATRRAAVLAGCCVLAMPALVTSSRTDQFSNGVGAAMCLAIWALFASDRMRRLWPTAAFGIACGAMTLTRTMAVSFIPAMAIGALLVVDLKDRRAWRNLVLAGASAVVVAVPWWWVRWDDVSAYLLSSGYGDRSYFYGQATIMGRLFEHLGYLARDLRAMLAIGIFVAVLALMRAFAGVLSSPRKWLARNRDLLAIWVIVAVSTLALLSSANRGLWFSTPLDSVLIAAVVATGSRMLRSPKVLSPAIVLVSGVAAALISVVAYSVAAIGATVGLVVLAVTVVCLIAWSRRRSSILAGAAVIVCLAAFAASLPLTGPPYRSGETSLRAQLAGGLERYMPTVHEADSRLSSTDLTTRRKAAAEWADAARELDRLLVDMEETMSIGGSGTLAEVVTGQRGLFETNTVAVARELGPRGVRWLVTPNTYEGSDSDLQEYLSPTAEGDTPRILIIIEGRSSPFPDALGWHRFVRLAERGGWELYRTIPLPDRGRVAVYVHPDNLEER